MTKKMDRRVKYTRALLKEALIELLQEKHISKISVKALCEKADVNRSTFYTHFSNQFALLSHIQNEVKNNLKHFLEQYIDDRMPITEQNLIGILEYAKKNKALFTVLLSENSDQAFQKDLIELVELIPFQYDIPPRKKEYILNFAITGCISVFHKWLREGAQESPQEMATLVLQTIYRGLLSF